MSLSKHPTVILIEDDFFMGRTIQLNLQSFNLLIRWAKTLEEGRRVISEHLAESYAVIIDGRLDKNVLSLPLVQQIVSADFKGLIVAISGEQELNNRMAEECLSIKTLSKPFTNNQLLEALEITQKTRTT